MVLVALEAGYVEFVAEKKLQKLDLFNDYSPDCAIATFSIKLSAVKQNAHLCFKKLTKVGV